MAFQGLDENHQDLEEILAPLNVGKRGSKILVTARNKEASLGAKRLISISDLDEEQYFLMFMHYALDSTIYDDRKYIPIGRKIAKKLCRSPIAAVTVAGQLWRNPDISFWETAARLDMLNKTKGALWWSYQQLDVDVRRCFEYWNIFPRRYELERDKLVHMWIAQGFVKAINAREEENVEDVGQDYFHDLHSCAFLQLKRKTSSDFSSGEYFTVHDLLHDLTEAVAGSDCVRIKRGAVGKIPKYVRHLCIESYSETVFPEQILELGNLSTLIMCYSVNKISQDDFKRVLMRLRKLRVVQLDMEWLHMIPACIGQLKHLRYLGISSPPPNSITLPAEFTMLYHLQELSVPPNTLLLCDSMDKMANLVNLRHMVSWYGFNFPNVGRLASLQSLYHFYVKNEKGYEIQQLEHLNNLRGKLFIECLKMLGARRKLSKPG
ncbi:putative disease resistance protein RGA3 [Panicum virgatum]|uniref:putative disease resistance protein RGA3 n=1 Tax=Panicum virgatum TaxID=38727 RepID=UPI0019D5C2B8|nr:putative disease resistance protein RGA3 [Panicum virgatum]